MFDGSALPLKENLDIAVKLLERFRKSDLILEIEAGVVGGEEDGISGERRGEALHDAGGHAGGRATAERGAGARYLLAATFGNVHGVYKPGHVKLKPSILKDCQDAVVAAFGEAARFYFVFHGGSGSELRDIHEALDYGVVKMNVDTDMQYAFTRAIADHCFKNYDGVLKVDGEVGNKKAYDPRSYLALAEAAMAERVKRAATELRSAGHGDGATERERGAACATAISISRSRGSATAASRRRCRAFDSSRDDERVLYPSTLDGAEDAWPERGGEPSGDGDRGPAGARCSSTRRRWPAASSRAAGSVPG